MKRALALCACLLIVSGASAQSAQAKAAWARLSARSLAGDFFDAVRAEQAALTDFSDILWLYAQAAGSAAAADQKKALLAERASILTMLGRYGEAAESWALAAGSVPGKPDARALLSAAACRLATGDTDEAAGLAKAIAFSGPDAYEAAMARLVSGWVALSRGEAALALAEAKAVVDGGPVEALAPALLLAASSAAEPERSAFRKRLAERLPSRPESGAGALFLFLSMASNVPGTPLSAPVSPVPATGGGTGGATAGAGGGTTAATVSAPRESPATGSTVRYYQLGAFRDKANADALVVRLGALGVKASVKFRDKPGSSVYLVYVATGSDSEAVVMKIKDAGYEAWLLEGAP